MGKNGSTSIQGTLLKNSDILEKNGFRYLNEWGQNHLRTVYRLFSPCPTVPKNAGALGRPIPNIKHERQKAITKMLNVMNTTKCETLIISGEYYQEFHLDSVMEKIKTFIKNHFQCKNIETTIVLFLRNPLPWIVSSVQEGAFKGGFSYKNNGDYYEMRMKQYEGIINLQKYFPDSLKLLKFEDACLDEDGLVGYFLKTIDFPASELKKINFFRLNESRSMEVIEFARYLEAVEPRFPFNDYRRSNPNITLKDVKHLKNIKGVKFDLPYQSKVNLLTRFQATILFLKENTGIDYTDYTIPEIPSQDTYSEETIQEFINVFQKLSIVVQKHFLKFFEAKYLETTEEKFKQLYFKDSVPYTIFANRNAIISLRSYYLKRKLREVLPRKAKKFLRRKLGYNLFQ